MKWMIMVSFFCIAVFSAAEKIQTEDLGSISKQKSIAEPQKKSEVVVDYSRLKGVSEEVPAVVNSGKIQTSEKSLKGMKAGTGTPFYRSLGAITIRASEDYVYIRAGKSVLVMNADGKIMIDSDHDLLISSNANLILKAKKDIHLKPGGELILPGKVFEKGSGEGGKEGSSSGIKDSVSR